MAVRKKDIIAILDIKSILNSKINREFLEMCKEEGFISETLNDKLRSFIIVRMVKDRNVCEIKIYCSPISALTLQKRANFIK